MLVLSRRKNESLLIGDKIELVVVDVRGEKVRLGINAPSDVTIVRKEILQPTAASMTESQRNPHKSTPLLIAIRNATTTDLSTINEIYNWYVLNSTCTYQEQVDSAESREEWFAHKSATGMPILVAEHGGQVIGWGSLAPFRERSGYRFTAEDAVYIHHEFLKQGVGSALLMQLIQLARLGSFHSIMAIIDAEQTGSVAAHAKLGFRKVGQLPQAGFKFGRWLDTVYMQLMLPTLPASADGHSH